MKIVSILFDKDKTHVLVKTNGHSIPMCSAGELESLNDASRRLVRDEYKLPDAVQIQFVMHEKVAMVNGLADSCYSAYVTCGVIEDDSMIKDTEYSFVEINELVKELIHLMHGSLVNYILTAKKILTGL